ncbi:MAG TPA: proteasome ATPase [Actinomycetota bacterium]|jgi:proteasome-associated ATPase|nr:proteasome ATPase [Actinomycetota bacterium]
MRGSSEFDRRIAAFEQEVGELQMHIKDLEEESSVLRSKLLDAPLKIRKLESQLSEVRHEASRSRTQSERMATLLAQAREQLVTLQQEIDKLSSPPSGYGVFLTYYEDGTADIFTGGRKLRVNVAPSVEAGTLVKGQEVRLNEALNVVEARGYEMQGEVALLKEVIDRDRAIVITHADDERVVSLSAQLDDTVLHAGDSVLLDPRSGYLMEKLPKAEVEELVLEEVPDIDYNAIGGLDEQIEALRDAVELPFLYSGLFNDYQLPPPKGVLLYGPPGCGKTLIAKAVANSLAKRTQEVTGREDVRAYFLNVKGPELLNKYVGETERQIRMIFQRAKEKSEEGVPVIVFFDEMESLFRTRGSGISSDIETTIVPQLLSELDGVEQLKNVIVIGASNREDLIDPAILRPGRLDVKIKVERPDHDSARAIFSKYLISEVPISPGEIERYGDVHAAIKAMIDVTVEEMYSVADSNRFLEVTYANGDKEVLFFKDFSSGAMIENIVRRAKKIAIKRLIANGEGGIRTTDLIESIHQEYHENEDLPNTTNPDDWARISGKKGERIVFVRTLVSEQKKADSRSIEQIQTGQYL